MPSGVYIRTKPGWNKNLTRETDERLVKAGRNISKAMKGKIFSEEHKKKLRKPRSEKAKANMKGHCGVYKHGPCSEATKRKLSKVHKGKSPWNIGLTKETDERVAKNAKNIRITTNRPEVKEKQSERMTMAMNRPETKEKLSKILKIVLNRPEVKEKQIEADLKKWANPEFQKKMAVSRTLKPNKLEQYFNKLTPDIVRYVGDFKFFITTKKHTHNPDFKIAGQKKIIELFGDYWHEGEDPKELIKEYADVNWDCIVFWEKEVYNDTEKILGETLEFIK